VLVLDGCCYIADLAHLERRLEGCLGEGGCGCSAMGGSSSRGGASSHSTTQPVLVSFEGASPALAGHAQAQVR
jgi:hypothetical protein